MSTKAFCPCGGGSNLILETGTENQILVLITPAAMNFFHQILKNFHFGVKKNIWFSLPVPKIKFDPFPPPPPPTHGEKLGP